MRLPDHSFSIVEPLEGRRLLSVAGAAGADAVAAAEAPTVRLATRSVVTSGTGHTFHLVFNAPAGVRPDTVSGDDVLITGPRGHSSNASVTRMTRSPDGKRLIVACRATAPGGSYDRADNGVYRIALREGGVSDHAGTPVPGGVIGGFRVLSRQRADRTQAPPPVLPLSTSATDGALTVELSGVYAWCDHMPWVGPEPAREYLVLSTVLKNNSDRPLEVRLDRAYWSFDEGQLGQETNIISVRSPHGRPSGVKTVVLQPGETRTVEFRGDGVYPEDRHGQRLFITLQFSAGDATAAVRNSGVVMVSH